MPAEYYLDTVRIVFQEHLLPRGLWDVAGERVAPEAITQHRAAHHRRRARRHLRPRPDPRRARAVHAASPPTRKRHLTVEGAGHYGIFSGRRWREKVYPQVRDFIAAADDAPVPQRRRSRLSWTRNSRARAAHAVR